jgi:hypothetical protein
MCRSHCYAVADLILLGICEKHLVYTAEALDIDWIGGGTGTIQRSTTSEHAPHTTTATTPELSVTPDEAPLLVGLHESYNDIDVRSTMVS